MKFEGNLCLVKYSRENILGRMQENFEENFDPDIKTFSAVEKLRPTRWTDCTCF